MERINHFTEETIETAKKLFESNTEMLHAYPEGGRDCKYCGKWRAQARFDEECPALLRAALEAYATKSMAVEPYQGCGICGGRMIKIRGRYPRDEERLACPTCAVERLEQINQISSREYGQAFKASPLIQPSSAGRGDTNAT